jgi:ABC-type transport system involved in multi-copper enzyme maturation permease subunit
MKPNRSLLTKIGYPLTALITTNVRMQLFTRRIIPPLIIVAIPFTLVFVMRVIFWIFSAKQEFNADTPFDIYSALCASAYLQFVVPMLALLRGLTVFSEEKKEKTITYLFLRPLPRWVLASGKYLGSLFTMCVLLAGSMIGAFLVLGSLPESNLLQGDIPVLLTDIGTLSLGLAAYGSVMMAIGTYFRKSLLIGIFLIFIWDPFAAYIPGFAHKFTIKYYLQCIFPHQESRDLISVFLTNHIPVSSMQAYAILAVIILTSLALTTLVLQHKEFVGEGGDVD